MPPHAADALAQPNVRTWTDPIDAVVRRTDEGNDDALVPGTRPDLLSVSISGWSPSNPTVDPYVGSVIPAGSAQILKLELVFRSLVNPPGPIQFPDIPTMFGASPLYGFLDLDVDQDIDTGGEQTMGRFNYLEEVARFGGVPVGAFSERAVTNRCQVDFDFETPPFYERSGADFTLAFCGCTPITIDERVEGDADNTFEPGETWIVRGRFFQRSGGYQCASFAFQQQPGSQDGLYDPETTLRFKHCQASNTTVVTLVFPLTMQGASILTGQALQQADFTFGGSNHFSVFEALNDVVTVVNENGEMGDCEVLAGGWRGRNPALYLNVTTWEATALFGTTYQTHPLGASFVWTDAGFAHTFGDITGDGRADSLDRAAIQSFIATFDGVPGSCFDCDEITNGSITLCNFAHNYNVRDLNYDGFVNIADVELIPPSCPADWDQENGVNTADFFAFLEDFFAGAADFNGDGRTNSADFLGFISAFFVGC